MQPTSLPSPTAVRPGPPDPARELAVARQVLECYQQALGHDLPNRLVALQGLASLLQQDLGPTIDGEARACLERLVAIPREVHAQVSALADVGRTCREPGPLAPVSLDDLLAEAQATVNFQCAGRLTVSAAGPLPAVLLPREAARRVAVEVFQFSARRAAADRPLRVRASCVQPAPGTTTLLLHDDGPALERAECAQAFEPAQGLGLFLARLLADGWGGSLELSGPAGGGCLWSIVIPHLPLEAGTET